MLQLTYKGIGSPSTFSSRVSWSCLMKFGRSSVKCFAMGLSACPEWIILEHCIKLLFSVVMKTEISYFKVMLKDF